MLYKILCRRSGCPDPREVLRSTRVHLSGSKTLPLGKKSKVGVGKICNDGSQSGRAMMSDLSNLTVAVRRTQVHVAQRLGFPFALANFLHLATSARAEYQLSFLLWKQNFNGVIIHTRTSTRERSKVEECHPAKQQRYQCNNFFQ